MLEEAHLPRPTAAKFEQLAKLSDEKFEQHITESAADKLTMNAALKKAARERQPGPVAERGFDGWAEMLAYRPDPDEEPDAGWDPLRDEW